MRNILPIALAALTLMGCTHGAPQQEPQPVKVNVQEVASSTAASFREYAGTVEESFTATLSFGASGRVTQLCVKEGQQVKAGQLLAQIDNSRALNAYRAAKASLDQAQDGYNRAKQVHDQGSLPEVKWIEVQSQLDQAQSMADMAKKSLEDCELRAPKAGTIGNRSIAVGTSVTAFQPVMDLVGLDGLYVKTSIPEDDINGVVVGTAATILVDESEVEGVVEERNPTADALTHSYAIRIRLKEAPKSLLPGMVGKVRIAQPTSPAAEGERTEIPARAVQIDNEGHRYVWVVEEGRAAQRYITIGDLAKHGVVVSDGLHAGDRIIVDGMLKVATGTPVTY